MTAYVWTSLSLLFLVLPAVSELPMPVNVTLTTSSNLSHMLKWEPGPGTHAGAYYQVSVGAERETSWEAVAGCQHVHYPFCNLTEAFPDPTKIYIIRVIARVEAQTSQPAIVSSFKPISHLGLPRLTVLSCGRHLCVDLYPPMEHLREIYNMLNYQLQIQSSNGQKPKFFKDKKSLKQEVLKDLAPGRQYCVSVRFSDLPETKESNFGQPVCAFTKGIFSADPLISAVLCLLVIAALVAVALLTYAGFICMSRQPLPLVLASIHHTEEVLNSKPNVPSAGDKCSMQSLSDEDDEESTMESSCENTGGYKLQGGTILFSTASSSSLSCGTSSSSLLDFSDPHLKVDVLTDIHKSAKHQHTLINCTSIDEKIKVHKEERKADGGDSKQDVNLFTLTFGRQEEEDLHFNLADVVLISPQCTKTHFLPPQNPDTTEVPAETEVEEIDKYSGYMKRPRTNVSLNFL